MRNLFYPLLLLFLLSCSSRDEGVTLLSYRSPGAGNDMVVVEELRVRERVPVDSARMQAGEEVQFSLNQAEAGFYLLVHGDKAPITLFLSPGEEVRITDLDDHGQIGYDVEGSPGSRLLREYFNRKLRDEARIDSLGQAFRQAQGEEDFPQIRERLDSTYYALMDGHKEHLARLILANDSSIVTLFLVNQRLGRQSLFSEEHDLPLLEHLDSLLYKLYPENLHVIEHHARLSDWQRERYELQLALGRLEPGSPAPALSMSDIDGRSWNLQDEEGREVLLHFWASVDARSRLDNRELAAFAKKHPGLNIISVSMDLSGESWKAAVKLDGLTGRQVSELAGMSSPAASAYLPEKKLPRYFLIGADGTIRIAANSVEQLSESYSSLAP